MLVLSELTSAMAPLHRVIWVCLGDFQKAFPRTDPSDLLVLLHNGPVIRHGAFALLVLEDTMLWDRLKIWLSGDNSTIVRNGLPEGGSLGSLTYTTLPDSLLRELIDAGFGVGVNVTVPAIWNDHVWMCRGTPVPALVVVALAFSF